MSPSVTVTEQGNTKVNVFQLGDTKVVIRSPGPQGPQGNSPDLSPYATSVQLTNHEAAEAAAREAAIAAHAAAEAAARAQAIADAIASHNSDGTAVHGIADTAALVVTTDPRLTDERTPPDGSVTPAKLSFDPVTQAELDAEAAARAAADATLIPLAQKGAALGVVPLNSDGKIADNYFGPYPISRPFPVTSQAEMLALTAEVGDIAIRSDNTRSYVLGGTGDPTLLDNWKELLSPTAIGGGVTSVDGRTGAVDLTDRYTALAHQDLTTAAHGGIVASTDPRLSDERVPPNGSVTLAKLAFDPATQTELDAHTTQTTGAHGGIVASSDSRLTDQRVPTDGSVTNSKVAAGAGIVESKLALDVATGLLIPKSLLTAKGQLVGATASGTPVAIPAPVTNGHVLTAASAQPSGVAWAAAAGGTPGVWTAYTPTLTADTTNPTLGTGSVQLGRYMRFGSLMIVHFRIVFGTSGVAAGSGAYHISIPVAVEGSIVRRQLGTVHLLDQSATVTKVAIARLDDTPFTSFQMNQVDTTGFGGIGNNTPWTWAASDVLSGYLVCEVAP